jgi:GNAT superfamily N-acetyltransferase
VVGVALALVREGVWILFLFAVAEEYRSAGVGRRLLERVSATPKAARAP